MLGTLKSLKELGVTTALDDFGTGREQYRPEPGVETEEQLETLRALGCQQRQGYQFESGNSC